MDRINGPIGTEVLLRIQRKGARKLVYSSRARFRVREVRHAMFDDIAYIRVAFFGPDTEKLLRKALGRDQEGNGRCQAVGIHYRYSQQSGRPCRSSDLVGGCFPRTGDDRCDDGPPCQRVSTLRRLSRGLRERQSNTHFAKTKHPHRHLKFWRGSEGQPSRHNYGNPQLWQRYRTDQISDRCPRPVQFTTHKFMTAAGIQIHEVGSCLISSSTATLAQPMVPPPHPSTDAQPPEKPGIECWVVPSYL